MSNIQHGDIPRGRAWVSTLEPKRHVVAVPERRMVLSSDRIRLSLLYGLIDDRALCWCTWRCRQHGRQQYTCIARSQRGTRCSREPPSTSSETANDPVETCCDMGEQVYSAAESDTAIVLMYVRGWVVDDLVRGLLEHHSGDIGDALCYKYGGDVVKRVHMFFVLVMVVAGMCNGGEDEGHALLCEGHAWQIAVVRMGMKRKEGRGGYVQHQVSKSEEIVRFTVSGFLWQILKPASYCQ